MKIIKLFIFLVMAGQALGQTLEECTNTLSMKDVAAQVCNNHYFHSIDLGAALEVKLQAGIVFGRNHYIFFDKHEETYQGEFFDEKLTGVLRGMKSLKVGSWHSVGQFHSQFMDLEDDPKYEDLFRKVLGEKRFEIDIAPLKTITTIRTEKSLVNAADSLGISNWHGHIKTTDTANGDRHQFLDEVVSRGLGSRLLGKALSSIEFSDGYPYAYIAEYNCKGYWDGRFPVYVLAVCPFTTERKKVEAKINLMEGELSGLKHRRCWSLPLLK